MFYASDGNLSIEVTNHHKCHFALALIADPEVRLYQNLLKHNKILYRKTIYCQKLDKHYDRYQSIVKL